MKAIHGSAPARTARATLAVVLGDGETPPTEFRLFVAGWNDTENGRFLFDEAAAAAVMSAHEKWGVDLMIDLEHQSLEEGIAPDPTAKDARGWCKLELREDGSLWAVNVTWTPDGEARLREKRQRYVSPAFSFDTKSSRVTKVVNVAITAIPATHDTPALVAARAERPTTRDLRKLSAGLAFYECTRIIEKALNARFLGSVSGCSPCPYLWVCDVFDASVVYELDGKLYELPYTIDGTTATLGDPPVEVIRSYAPAPKAAPPAPTATNRKQPTAKLAAAGDVMNTKQVAEAVEAIKNQDSTKALEILEAMLVTAAGGEPPPDASETTETTETNSAEGEPKKDEESVAAARVAMTLTGKANPGEAMAELARRSKVAVELEEREAKLSADRATLEASERRALVAQLVKLGVEIPATAWSDEKGTVPVARLAAEPIAELRDRVAKLSAAGGGRTTPRPPTGTGVHGLSERELAMCAAKKIDPAKYAENKAAISGRSHAKGA